MGRIGPLQLEAAIQSAHVAARRSGSPDNGALALLYETLVRMTPTVGVRVAHAVALSRTEGPARGLQLLDALESTVQDDYQPYWSARAHLLERAGQVDEAGAAYERAIGLAEEDGVRRWLLTQKRALGGTARLPGTIAKRR
jgi:RNA polymerase sigma-70 factor (ECF subfamily)